jgi:hypothetical protein
VHREERDSEEKREDLLAESADKNYILHLNILQVHLCGRSPRERVNHVYIVSYV